MVDLAGGRARKLYEAHLGKVTEGNSIIMARHHGMTKKTAKKKQKRVKKKRQRRRKKTK